VTVLVTGAAGGLGHNVVDAAVRRSIPVRALVRDPRRASFPGGVEVVVGDALDADAVARAAAGCDALFHMVNVRFSRAWVPMTAALLDAALAACARSGARLLFPANVWVFGPGGTGARLGEDAPVAPASMKGRARAANEARIRASGVRFTMLRLPEFYGPHVGTLTGPPLLRIAHGGRGTWYGAPDVDVEFAYMPDAAEALLTVGLADSVDGATFHLPGAAAVTPRRFLALAIDVAGGGRARHVPAWIVRLAAIPSAPAREFADILHLWTTPTLLDGAKLAARFPQLTATPYRDGIAATIAWLRANPGAAMHY
jgi:nucleoside-diphosphate-sugar epimerase